MSKHPPIPGYELLRRTWKRLCTRSDPKHHPTIAIPGYELLKILSSGGRRVYLARQLSSGNLVHLNVAYSEGDLGLAVAAGLRQQAALLATLDHPNILRPVEVGGAEGYGFFSALEYTAGDISEKVLRTGPLPAPEAASIARDIASALQYGRALNVVQVNLTPYSVLLAEGGAPKLADFQQISAVHTNLWVFNPEYIAPEEVLGPMGSPATDVYRIGGVLYAMLTGQPPVSDDRDTGETIWPALTRSPAPARQLNPAAPADLEAICMKCLEKQPQDRYLELRDLLHVLDNFLIANSPTA